MKENKDDGGYKFFCITMSVTCISIMFMSIGNIFSKLLTSDIVKHNNKYRSYLDDSNFNSFDLLQLQRTDDEYRLGFAGDMTAYLIGHSASIVITLILSFIIGCMLSVRPRSKEKPAHNKISGIETTKYNTRQQIIILHQHKAQQWQHSSLKASQKV